MANDEMGIRRVVRGADQLIARLLIILVKTYRLTLSPWLGRQCRFYPTCSQYALDALNTHSGVRGAWLSIRRIGRCHPFHPGGIDEVPGHPNH